MNRLHKSLLIAFAILIGGCATAPHSHDPLEPVNRTIFKFNEVADKVVVRPIAKGYRSYVPSVVRTGVRNFFRNLGVLNTALNDALQLKPKSVPVDLARFTTNFIFGVGGIFDVATDMGIPYNKEDFGQTMGYWGIGSGPYIVLPLLGPSTLRDTLAKPVGFATDPTSYIADDSTRYKLLGLQIIDTRANLIDAESMLSSAAIDKYSFIRDTWLQRREYQINDGRKANSSGEIGQQTKSLRELELEEFGDY